MKTFLIVLLIPLILCLGLVVSCGDDDDDDDGDECHSECYHCDYTCLDAKEWLSDIHGGDLWSARYYEDCMNGTPFGNCFLDCARNTCEDDNFSACLDICNEDFNPVAQ